jgi:GT2 family glycosyltransferase
MKTLSIIVVNYNTSQLLKDCLENLQNLYSNSQVIVVDNGSTDGSADMVEQTFKDVVLIRTKNNGLAAGNNLGLAKAVGDYILYLGTDAFPSKETIAGMIDYMNNNQDVGISTAKLVLRDGSVDMDAHRGFPTPWAAFTRFSKLGSVFPHSKIFNQYFLGYKNLNQAHEIDLCIAHFMLVRKEVFDKIGKWDERFFLYGEDVDLCYRTKQAGFKIMYLPQYEVLHYKGATVGIRKSSSDIKSEATKSEEHKKKMRKETTAAMRIFYEKHYKKVYPTWLTGLVLFAIELLGKLREHGKFLS